MIPVVTVKLKSALGQDEDKAGHYVIGKNPVTR